MSAEFCDTNVLVYAHERSAGAKRDHAKALSQRLWESRSGAVSVQVLQELFVTFTRKSAPPLSNEQARAIIADLATWQVIEPSGGDVLDAIDAAARWRVSFWDAMVLTTARNARASVLWSEGLNDGQDYDGVIVKNPFRDLCRTAAPSRRLPVSRLPRAPSLGRAAGKQP